MTDLAVHRFSGRDGVELAYRELGEGRPLVLLHGFTADGSQWIHPGPALTLAGQGYRVILPDLRGHGDSARPHDPACYPPDVMADDGLALIESLSLDDYDLGGYSWGARTALRMLVRGARPARVIAGGQGLDVVTQAGNPRGRYRRVLTAMADGETLEPGSPEAGQAAWITRLGGDPEALLHVLGTHVPTPRAAALPNARFTRVPGDHFTAFTSPEFAAAITAFLGPAS